MSLSVLTTCHLFAPLSCLLASSLFQLSIFVKCHRGHCNSPVLFEDLCSLWQLRCMRFGAVQSKACLYCFFFFLIFCFFFSYFREVVLKKFLHNICVFSLDLPFCWEPLAERDLRAVAWIMLPRLLRWGKKTEEKIRMKLKGRFQGFLPHTFLFWKAAS